MKRRNGFISNSSSCSFTIVSKKHEKFEVQKRIMEELGVKANGVDLTAMAEQMAEAYFEDEVTKFRTLEQIEDYYLDELMYDKESMLEEEEFKILKSLVEAGFTIYQGSMPNSGDGGTQMQQMMYNARLNIQKPDFAMLQPSDDKEKELLYLVKKEPSLFD